MLVKRCPQALHQAKSVHKQAMRIIYIYAELYYYYEAIAAATLPTLKDSRSHLYQQLFTEMQCPNHKRYHLLYLL